MKYLMLYAGGGEHGDDLVGVLDLTDEVLAKFVKWREMLHTLALPAWSGVADIRVWQCVEWYRLSSADQETTDPDLDLDSLVRDDRALLVDVVPFNREQAEGFRTDLDRAVIKTHAIEFTCDGKYCEREYWSQVDWEMLEPLLPVLPAETSGRQAAA